MITKYPNNSTLSSGPLWISEEYPILKTIQRSDYKGHFHSTKIPGPGCLIAKNKKFKVSAYLSTLPLSPPENSYNGKAGKKWLEDSFESKEVKYRRGNSLQLSNDSFDVSSNYQMQFIPKPIEIRKKYVPKHIPLKTLEKFESLSTYNTDFQNKLHNRDDLCYILQQRQPSNVLTWRNDDGVQQQQPFYKRLELPPLESTTSYRTQFPSWTVSPRKYYKIVEPKPITHSSFDDESIYKGDFTPKSNNVTFTGNPIMSSCGFMKRELSLNQASFVPYLEYERPVFYNVVKED